MPRLVRSHSSPTTSRVDLTDSWSGRDPFVDNFQNLLAFAALQRQNLETAFGIWNQDPGWKQHPDKYSKYSYGEFDQDWGPSGEWGLIKSYAIDCSYSSGSGVIIQTTVNRRTKHGYVWVDKSDKTLHFSPDEIDCGNWWGWMTE